MCGGENVRESGSSELEEHPSMMGVRVVVVGAAGLFGEACCRILGEYPEVSEVVELTREVVDLEDLGALEKFLSCEVFDVLINAAAISGLEACLDDENRATRVNVDAPRLMAKVCAEAGAKMVHISTDYVFDGELDARCSEDSEANPVNVYGETKRAGELAVLEQSDAALVARVSWLFGGGRETFVDQVVDAWRSGGVKPCIGDKYSVPNFCDDLVKALWQVLQQDGAGVLHLCCDAEPESWYSYAGKLLEMLGADVEGVLLEQKLSEATFFRECRPKHTAMVSRRLQGEFGVSIRSWEQGLRDYLQHTDEDDLTSRIL